MKQFLKSALYAALLLSPIAVSADCSESNCSNSFNGSRRNSDDCSSGCSDRRSSCSDNRCSNNSFSRCSDDRCSDNSFNRCSDSCSDRRSSCSDSCSDRFSSDCSNNCFTSCGRGYVNFRSQGANTARELVGWQTEINKFGMGQWYGATTLLFEYTQSFKNKRIARALFGSDTLRFAGSAVTTGRDPRALVADLFGLPSTFVGSIRLRPNIKNYIFEWDGFIGFDDCDSCWNGAWFRFHAPLVHTRWNLGLKRACETIVTTTGTPFPVCAFSATSETPPARDIITALSGDFSVDGTNRFLCSGLFPVCSRKKTRLADIDLEFGYNFINNECSHLGLFLMVVAPTGNKQNARHVFHPVVGNGKHVEVGVGFTGHTILWDDYCNNQVLAIYGEGNITHMFKNRQCRLLDFCNNGPFSRYLLLREFQADGLTPTGNIVSATCFNTRNVHVRVDVKGDASFKLAYRWCGWGFDLGYNIYGHSREKIRFNDDCSSGCDADTRRLGIAGTIGTCCNTFPVAGLIGGSCNLVTGPSTGTSLIGATFSTSNAFTPTPVSSADNYNFASGVPPFTTEGTTVCLLAGQNPAVGTPVPTGAGGLTACTVTTPVLAPSSGIRPVLVTINDLDPRSAEACSVLTHKIFFHTSYMWADDCGWNPHLGIGGEVEFDGQCHERSTLNQWGVWIKGGVSF